MPETRLFPEFTSGEYEVRGWGIAHTRREAVKKKKNTCTSAPGGLLQRQ